ncbi:MAG: hypothetical protein JSV82_05680 [Planctomycetota bacterium]|nr:MAG: hypothetical protein JSV82_05680 [Planctomycetota bacterium]
MESVISYKTMTLLLLHILVVFLIPNGAVGQNKKPLTITKVALDTKTFDPSKGEAVNLSYEINKQTDAKVSIFDVLGQEVKCFNLTGLESGRHSVTWDGLTANGKQASGNVFLYSIEASDGQNKTTYNPAAETGGGLVKPWEFIFDKKSGKVEYVLPKACMIRLRAGLNNGMMARTIFDWQPRPAGRHTYKWDGKDEAGLMNLSNHPELDLHLSCYTLPSNTIIVTGQIVPLKSYGKDSKDKTATNKESDPWARAGKYLHYTHNPRNCHEPRFTVKFPNRKDTNEQSDPTVSGITQIRIELDKRDANYLINKRFEIILYVDGIYIFEMEEGSAPFTFNWNTKGLTKGPHILTVNLMSYDGHIGVVSRRILVEE